MRDHAPILLAMLVIVASGCGIEHRSPAYGRSYREAMEMQAKPPASPSREPNMALDTQEAEVISGVYVRSLAGKSKVDAEPEPVLYVAPPQRQTGNHSPSRVRAQELRRVMRAPPGGQRGSIIIWAVLALGMIGAIHRRSRSPSGRHQSVRGSLQNGVDSAALAGAGVLDATPDGCHAHATLPWHSRRAMSRTAAWRS